MKVRALQNVTRIRATFQLLRCPLVSTSPDPTFVVRASNEEMGTTDENYLVHQFLMSLKRQFESMRHFLLSWRLGCYFVSASDGHH
ncbi:hypothetical protein BDR03DRAFT_105286 [Suillus americanus]|nr:hypothetical protein BDR03DRAFT_105286 [Suillus americanus]